LCVVHLRDVSPVSHETGAVANIRAVVAGAEQHSNQPEAEVVRKT
jgi:hypothetical protein